MSFLEVIIIRHQTVDVEALVTTVTDSAIGEDFLAIDGSLDISTLDFQRNTLTTGRFIQVSGGNADVLSVNVINSHIGSDLM